MPSTVKYASFLVRLWRRCPPDASTPVGEWHGEVEYIQTGMKCEFNEMEELLKFLTQCTAYPSTWHSLDSSFD